MFRWTGLPPRIEMTQNAKAAHHNVTISALTLLNNLEIFGRLSSGSSGGHRMPDVSERKIKEAWNKFRPTGQVFNYTEERPMRVRVPVPANSSSDANDKQQSVFMEFFLETGGMSGLPVFRIIGALPHRNLKITLETIFNSGCATPGRRAVQL
jgi:hypothetical protein